MVKNKNNKNKKYTRANAYMHITHAKSDQKKKNEKQTSDTEKKKTPSEKENNKKKKNTADSIQAITSAF